MMITIQEQGENTQMTIAGLPMTKLIGRQNTTSTGWIVLL
jgi:hypothetical protein